jgi:RNA polymerase sigma factor (sigma-70 family)
MTREEFSEYVDTEYERLLRFVKSRVGNPQDAEDLLQKTLLKLLPNRAEIDAGNPGGYVFRALKTAIIDHWRKQGRRPAHGELPEQVTDPEAADPTLFIPADSERAEQRCRAVLAEAAGRLTERERRAFSAYWRALGDRTSALAQFGLGQAERDDKEDRQEKYRVYDGPLTHARRKLNETLQAHWEILDDIGPHRVWELVHEVFCGGPPDAAL